MITIDGLISGIDTETIINGLLEVQQTQIDRLELRRKSIEGKQAAYSSLEIQLQSLDSTADRLALNRGSIFSSRSVAVSKESSLFAVASTRAAVGTYQIHIDALARAHQVATNGFTSGEAEITQGTLEIQVGDGDSVSIEVNSSNNTLEELTAAINNSEASVTATLINDGSGTNPVRLLITADQTGTANEVTIVNNLAADTGSATQPIFDLGNPVQAASNAVVRLGSGAGALSVESSENVIDDLIQGVTLNLLAADANEPIEVRVSTNTEPAKTAIKDLVNSYNSIMDFVDEVVGYNPETDEAGLLIGDRTVTDVQNELRTALLDVVPGLNPTANRLSVLGISLNDRARLVINETRLEEVLAGRVDGIEESDLKNLFSRYSNTIVTREVELNGVPLDPEVESFEVVLTQAAEHARVQGNSTLVATTLTFLNDRLDLRVDGIPISLDLPNGLYLPGQLGTLIENEINSHPSLGGRTVTVTVDGLSRLNIQSDSLGGDSEIAITGGSARLLLGLSGNPSDTGSDVQGHYLVNGNIEPATGLGEILTGDPGNQYTANLQTSGTDEEQVFQVTETSDTTAWTGIGSRISDVIASLTDIEAGELTTAKQGIVDQLSSLDDSITRQKQVFESQQADLIAQFVALESAISELQTTSSFLASQLGTLGRIGTNQSK